MRDRWARAKHGCDDRGARSRPRLGRRSGFTLAEVLAALVFMAIVIPVAVQGLRLASLAGQVGERKAAAASVAERLLNEWVITGQWQQTAQQGLVEDGDRQYLWHLQLEPWEDGILRLMTVTVTFPVQGQAYDVRMSTLVDVSSL